MIRPDYRTFQSQNELYHYGMPRRSGRYPWGSGDKPYQSVKDALKGKRRSDYFTSERTIPKGTKMFRTTVDANPGFQTGHSTYVTYLEADRDLYRGGYIRRRTNGDQAYEHEMILEKDIRIPSRQTYKNTIEEVINKNPELLKDSVKGYWEQLIPENSWDRYEIIYDEEKGTYDNSRWDGFLNYEYNKVKDIPVVERWVDISRSLGKADVLKDAIIKSLQDKGYNAIVDEASVGGGDVPVEGIDPLIIFDQSVLSVNKTKKISTNKETRATNRYGKWTSRSRRSGKKGLW